MESNSCKICGSKSLAKKAIAGYKYLFCRNCEVMYLEEMPAESKLSEFYKSDYKITESDYAKTEARRLFRIPEQISLIADISKRKKPPAKICDIGCDKGFFLDEARRFGYDTIGVEPSVSARDYCKRIGLECLPDLNDLSRKQDIFVMWHSLEHHPNPHSTLGTINRKLNGHGLIFIRVPDYQSIYRKIFGSKWIWFQPENHYWHYSQQSLRILLELSGFDVLEIESRKPNNSLTKKMNRLSNRSFKKFALRKSLKNKIGRIYEDIVGVEIFAIAKKK